MTQTWDINEKNNDFQSHKQSECWLFFEAFGNIRKQRNGKFRFEEATGLKNRACSCKVGGFVWRRLKSKSK